jgi:hypothetical protein
MLYISVGKQNSSNIDIYYSAGRAFGNDAGNRRTFKAGFRGEKG